MLDQLNQAAASIGGSWVKLRTTDDPPVEGKVLSFEIRDRTTPDGDVVYKKGTTTARKEWVFALEVDGSEEPVKLSLNESGQRAVGDALKEAGAQAKEGDVLKIAVKENPASSYEQATYQARWTSTAATLAVPAADDGDPF